MFLSEVLIFFSPLLNKAESWKLISVSRCGSLLWGNRVCVCVCSPYVTSSSWTKMTNWWRGKALGPIIRYDLWISDFLICMNPLRAFSPHERHGSYPLLCAASQAAVRCVTSLFRLILPERRNSNKNQSEACPKSLSVTHHNFPFALRLWRKMSLLWFFYFFYFWRGE